MTAEVDSCTGGPRLPTIKDYRLVGEVVRGRRTELGLSLEDAGLALSLALKPLRGTECCRGHDYLRRIEEGTIAPHPEHLVALERVLETLPGELHHAYGYLAGNEVPPLGEDYVSLTEAARILGVSKGSVHSAVARGRLRARRLMPPAGRASLVLLVRRADLEDYEPRNYPRRAVTPSC